MPSILPGYEYDIFISYRHKDNRSDKWVSNFVRALQDEIDATFKVKVSVYFDENPHDGLAETHDVDQSLQHKVKSLIFLPIVSRTYCDPNSFAWKNEFLPFIEQAKDDEFGLSLKLRNGNVARRILPIRIHELDEADKNMFEEHYGGPMRGVDFIYKNAGVNRPLYPNETDPAGNSYNLQYRDQINKVANSIKDLIDAMRYRDQILQSTVNEPIDTIDTGNDKSRNKFKVLTQAFIMAGAYLLGSWAFLQLLELILSRFQLSPHWMDIFLYAFVLFIPAIIVLLVVPKDAKSRSWVMIRKLAPPVNLSIIAIILSITFWGRDLGAITRLVEIEDENGNTTRFKVIKEDYITRLLITPMSPDETLDDKDKWIAKSMREGIAATLTPFNSLDYGISMEEASGLKDKIQQLEDSNMDYLLSGSLKKAGDSLLLELQLINRRGEVIGSNNLSSTSLFDLFDLSRDFILEILEIRTDEVRIPFTEYYTDDIGAWEAYSKNDITGAIEKDPDFAVAWQRKLLSAIQLSNSIELRKRVADEMIKYIDRLPEEEQLLSKTLYWWSLDETDKAERVLNQYELLNPDDERIDGLKGMFFWLAGKTKKAALHMYEGTMEENWGPRSFYLPFTLLLVSNELEKASSLLTNYEEMLPLYQAKVLGALIDIQLREYDSAFAKLEKAQIDRPDFPAIDSLFKVVEFQKQFSNEYLDSLYRSLENSYHVDQHNLTFNYSFNGSCMTFALGKRHTNTLYLIDTRQTYNIYVNGNKYGYSDLFMLNETGDIHKIKAFSMRNETDLIYDYHFRFSDNLNNAIRSMNSGDFKAADSLIDIELQQTDPFFFIEGYKEAIQYQVSGSRSGIFDDLAGKKFRKKDDNAFAFIVLDRGDHFAFEFNSSIDDVYPTHANELINVDSRSRRYKVSEGPNGKVITLYIWDHMLESWNEERQYIEEVPEEL